MNAQKIQQFYLRAMYSEIPETNPVTEEETFVRQNLSSERLQIERAARLRNLRTVLHNDMRLLSKKIDKADLLLVVQNYAASPHFWMHRGRTLIEDFCLYFTEFAGFDPLHKLLACIEGVHSGLSVSLEAKTPWPTHQIERQGEDTLEIFSAPFALSWNNIFNNLEGYQPERQDVNCFMRRSGDKIHVNFQRSIESCN